jgi:N-acetylglucosamine-6-phosphate deacetylase
MAWFDPQVNGYGGVDFNQDGLKDGDLHLACEMLRAHGFRGILATIISDSIERMASRIRRLISLRSMDRLAQEMIWGVHVEGPFLNPRDGFRGAHPIDAICPADIAMAGRLLDAGQGLIRLFTLAPEQDPKAETTRFLAQRNVVVSAGHTDAGIDALKRARDAGLSMFTHLGNGCPMVMPRHDNIVQRVLSLRKDLDLCFIADGIHIPFFVLRNYFDLIEAKEKIIVTTDAMSAAGLGPGRYRLGRWELTVDSDLAVRSADGTHLVASAVPMPRIIGNLRQELNLEDAVIAKVASDNARRALHFTDTLNGEAPTVP